MKKTLLLATTAMLLSTVAMNTNAASNSAELEIHAFFINPLEMVSEQYLGFGTILADEGGKTVVVTSDGELGAGTTATMMSTGEWTNYGNTTTYGSLNEGLIRVKNVSEIYYNDPMYTIADMMNISFSDETVELTDYEGNACGTVSNFTTDASIEGDDAFIHVGGTLTTADLSGTTSSTACFGYTTVTFVLNDDTFAAIQNARQNQ